VKIFSKEYNLGKVKTRDKKNMKIGLLGASFDTGNMGVSALAESSIKCIIHRWPDAEIILLGSGYEPHQFHIRIMEKEIVARTIPIRFSKNIFLPYHFLWFAFFGLFSKILPGAQAKDILFSLNRYVETLFEADLVVDITGGDSFSDIYGLQRFLFHASKKWLVILFGKKLIMLPQTYGPFDKRLTRVLARHILNRTITIYSRDRNGVELVKHMLKTKNVESKVKFSPDVAFVLDAHRPDAAEINSLEEIRGENTIVVGLNISGLLYHGGYTRNNMFGLKTDYVCLIHSVIDLLMGYDNVVVLLVPHVFPPAGYEVESDPEVCSEVYKWASEKYEGRVFLTRCEYNHNEIKYIIGLCDFFIGSRMHACIAAISQNIPTMGLAYSKKFEGVFESIGLGDCVADTRNCDEEEVLEKLESVFKRRNQIRNQLEHVIPQVKENILGIFNN
jgi:colanic acid/amylovoran biosynthesis protein